MELTFKNVNQGDSIIISWKDINQKNKTGIIDCHIGNENPVLKYLKDNEIKEIEFLIISHPHYDHFSGVLEIFEYCKKENICINELGFSFLTSVSIAYKDLSYSKALFLRRFFDFIIEQSKSKLRTIKHTFTITSDTKSRSFNEFELDFLHPLNDEILNFARNLSLYSHDHLKTKPDLNIYSTVIEIKNQNKSFLLTSDSPKKSFDSLRRYFTDKKTIFHLVQIPHHGSIKNHNLKFWQNLKKTDKCPAVFSVGMELRDRLPNKEVVEEIFNENYKIYATNPVFGISDFFNLKPTIKKPTIMSKTSRVVKRTNLNNINSQFSGDHTFVF